tara:strand:- start:7990 stop:8460 length:471 start_codon:yes stop_codon:yes gene_type:complete
MKSILLVFIAVLIPTITTSQLNSKIWSASAFQAASGFADGTNQAYLFHYGNTDIFARWGISPNEEAWKNKWVVDPDGVVRVGFERFWLSSRSLVFLTDFHHATRFAKHRFNEASLITYAIGHGAKTKKWYWYLADTAIMFTARSVGFYASYNLIFK